MKKIVAFTAIRSEYDLLSSLFKLLNADDEIELKLIVSGAHLSKTFGYSVTEIEADGLDILLKIETLLDSDTTSSRIKSASILLQNSIDVISNYNPEIIIFAGDREEVIVASLIAGYLEIPSIHFFGGDHVKDSHIDNPIRHATSKLSSIHMVSTSEHYDRLKKMGEAEDRIFNIGNISLDKFISEKPDTILAIKENLGINPAFFEKFALVIFHPLPIERKNSAQIFENILLSLLEKKINAFVGYPNIDPGNLGIIKIIEKYKDEKNFFFYRNLPRKTFLSIYKNSRFIIGNSSSGIMESASIPIPAINVGLRQLGRKINENTIFSSTERNEITKNIDRVLSKEFQVKLRNMVNIYGDGNSAKKAYEIIKTSNFKTLVAKNEDILDLI